MLVVFLWIKRHPWASRSRCALQASFGLLRMSRKLEVAHKRSALDSIPEVIRTIVSEALLK